MHKEQIEQYREAMAALDEQRAWSAVREAELDFLLSQTAPEVLAGEGVTLVCDSEEQARAFRPLLDARGLSHVATRVAAPLPTFKERLAAAQQRAKEAAGRRMWPAGPAYTPPTTKARKAARRRSKAGRKASR